jgi:hypothetical protein
MSSDVTGLSVGKRKKQEVTKSQIIAIIADQFKIIRSKKKKEREGSEKILTASPPPRLRREKTGNNKKPDYYNYCNLKKI